MKENNSGSSIGFGSLLLLTFIVLKLTGVISWSWWWVLSPMWTVVLLIIIVSIVEYTIYKK